MIPRSKCSATHGFDHGPVSGQAASRRELDDKVIPRPGVRADCLPGFMHDSSAQQPNPVSPLGGLGLYVPIPGSTSYLLPIIYGSSAFTGVKPCFPEKILRKQLHVLRQQNSSLGVSQTSLSAPAENFTIKGGSQFRNRLLLWPIQFFT